jgi:hypothetical protein
MSKFVDKLQSLYKSSTTPIGFRASISELKSPAMLLVARLSGTKLDEAKIGTKTVGQMAKALGDIPLGVFVKSMSEERIDELASLGCDFVVFDISMPALILQKEEVGRFLMIEPSLDLGFVKAINSLNVDGVFISSRSDDASIDVEHLLVCRRFVEIIEKPVIVDLPASVTKTELTDMRQTGIVGLVAGRKQSAETLRELGKLIN